MFGSHLSVAGGLHHALPEARRLHMDCVQIFTKNQRQWRVKPLTDEAITLWRGHRKDTGIDPVVSHASYLINLASPETAQRNKSLELFFDELTRCETLDIAYLVVHPGSHMQTSEAAGLKRIARCLDRVHKDLPGLSVQTCLEVTAGQGASLGYRFEHLHQIMDQVKEPQRLAICLDTAHMLAAGYDLTSGVGCRKVISELDDIVGLDQVKVLHLNDSKVPLGKRVDRHTHIGHGHVSLDAFKVLVNHARFKAVAKILETPKEVAPNGTDWDTVNLQTLKSLLRRRKTKNI